MWDVAADAANVFAVDSEGDVTATSFTGDGAGLDNVAPGAHTHDGSDITSGEVAATRIEASIARDGEIMPTVLANDGAGSTLDADLLDGQDPSAFASSSHDHDAAYVNEGQADSVTSAMIVNCAVTDADLQHGAALAEILDNDGNGSGLDADLLDGEESAYYQNASNINTGSLGDGYFSAYSDLTAEGYLDNNAAADLLTRSQGDVRYWSLTGNSGATPGVNFLGTTDNQPFEIKVNGQRLWRAEPDAASPSPVGGYSGSSVMGGTLGATVSSGGRNGSTNRVTDDYGAIGGGYGNQAGNNDSTTADYATVSGGAGNAASKDGAAVGGGWSNTASGVTATVAGGTFNTASGTDSVIGGGSNNIASGAQIATIAGGGANTASGSFSSIGGGSGNTASADGAAIGGGSVNAASGINATVGGASYNTASADYAAIAAGGSSDTNNPTTTNNLVTDDYGTIAGGGGNQAGDYAGATNDANYATVSGGKNNVASNFCATVGGGQDNSARKWHTTVGGGENNTASGPDTTVGGGSWNAASGQAAAIVGGNGNAAAGWSATVSGGEGNVASKMRTTVSGGWNNTASERGATIGGDEKNVTSGQCATVGGGEQNAANADYATISGGDPSDLSNSETTRNIVTDGYGTIGAGGNNQAGDDAGTTTDARYATVSGGSGNTASAGVSTVGGGSENTASQWGATVGGGQGNNASGGWVTIAGGKGNAASGERATVSGGQDNSGAGWYATVGGVVQNASSGDSATVPGGTSSTAAGNYSFAAGSSAKANHQGSFVWADNRISGAFASQRDYQLRVRAYGGARFEDGAGLWVELNWSPIINPSTGAQLTNGGVWTNASDRNAKENFKEVDGKEALKRLAEVPITEWSYKAEGDGIRHIGPVAQDFYAAFGLGDSYKTIGTVDADGVALAAIQGLYDLLKEKGAEAAQLRETLKVQRHENAAQKRRIAHLESRMTAIEALMTK